MHRHGLRPTPWQRQLLAATALLLLASGGLWLALHYGVGAGADALPHPAEPWLMRLHGAGAFLALFAAGTLAGHHIPAAWRHSHRPRQAAQRRSGLAGVVLGGLTVLSGYALYYLVSEATRPALGWLHAGLGLALAASSWWHGQWRRRQLRRDTLP